MAKNMQPVLKRCRTLGVSPAAMGYNKTSNKNPGGQRRAKKSEYATQLTEKQKVKFVYGIQEKQFRNYYDKAARAEGNTGEVLLTYCERRLDNVVYRLGFANTRRQARQLVNHGHFTVNGNHVNIPSYLIKVGDVVAVSEKASSNAFFKKLKMLSLLPPSGWIVIRTPSRVRSLLCPPRQISTSISQCISSSSCTPSNAIPPTVRIIVMWGDILPIPLRRVLIHGRN